MPQGLKPASAYFTAMVTDLLNTAIGGAGAGVPRASTDANGQFTPATPTDGMHGGGTAWSVGQWHIGWIDDWMHMANTPARCKARQDILIDVLIVAGISLSPKCSFKVSETGKLAGMHWIQDGHCLGDEAIESLPIILARRPLTKSDAKKIIGVITYSASDFEYTSTELSRHAELMATLNASVEPIRVRWDHECDAAMVELRERMQNQPRKLYDPIELLDGDHCLVIMGDAAETGIGAGLFLVQKSNPDDVVPDDITAETAICIDVCHKVLNSGERRWQVFELETYTMVESVRK